MELDEITARIAESTGIPAKLLDGKTPEENIAKARALLEYRMASGKPQSDKELSTGEKFAAWFESRYGDNQGAQEPDPAIMALDNLAAELNIANGGYPILQDNGELDSRGLPDSRPVREQFADYLNDLFGYRL